MVLSEKEVYEQSMSAMAQWEELWRKNAIRNGELFKNNPISQSDIVHTGAGRNLVCIANGSSLKKQMKTLKENINEHTDIACVDKVAGLLIKEGVKPNFVIIADASVSYEEWCQPWIEETQDIILMCNVLANPKWPENWKGPVIFYVNKDNIQSEKIFMELSGVREVIPASSNVGNTVIVIAVQILGYDKYMLLGYDYCWHDDEPYYATNDSDKRYWMKHLAAIDNTGRLVNTSQNLLFSAKWLTDFHSAVCREMKLNIVNCSVQGMFIFPQGKLKAELLLCKKRELSPEEKKIIIDKRIKSIVINSSNGGNETLNKVLSSVNVAEIVVKHIPKEVIQWLN